MNKKVLLADDSITIQKVVDIIFATEDYELTTTDDGDKALEKAIQEHPDMVIADISMPGKDGFELCRTIKSDPALKKTAVLLLPGAFDHFDEQKAHDVCADGWLTKPFESQALLDKVAQLLAAEPLRLIADEAEDESAEDLTGPAAAAELPDEEEAVTDSSLGLDQVDGLASDDSDESAEDIWDAVSFAEEDLEPEEAADEEDDAFSSAAGATVEPASAEQEPEEPGPAASTVVDSGSDSGTAFVGLPEGSDPDEDSNLNVFTDDQPANESETIGQSINPLDQVSAPSIDPAAESEDNEEDVDFSRFSEGDFAATVSTTTDTDQPGSTSEPEAATNPAFESTADEDADFIDSDDFETLNPDEEGDLAASTGEQNTAAAVASEDDSSSEFPAAAASQPTDLYAASVAAADAMVSDAEDDSDSEAIEEDILELNEDDIVVDEAEKFDIVGNSDQQRKDATTEADTGFSGDEPASGFANAAVDTAPLDEESAPVETERAAGEDDDDFVFADEEPLADAVTVAPGLEDEDHEAESEGVAADTVPLDEESTPAVAEHAEEEDDEFVFTDEEPLADAVTTASSSAAEDSPAEAVDPDAAEDEDVYFAVPAEDSSTSVDKGPTTVPASVQAEDQIEQQLRELSEEELQELVAKVAGPLIEKMAGEMLEQIAWEVVPDLAEAMIKEEIRKLKEAVR